MRALVINLAQETGRRAFQIAQGHRLGLQIEVLPAVTVADLSPAADDPCWTRWQRRLRDVEKATLLSHKAAWARVIAAQVPLLVLEDDALLLPGVAKVLAQAVLLTGVEHLSLETRGRRKVLGQMHPQMPAVRRLWLDRSGAAAYLLWPEGARKLLRRAEAVPALADAVPVETPGLLRWQACPAWAVQMDIAARYGLTAPIAVKSSISGVPPPSRGGMRFRLRRIGRQLWMGLAALRPGTERIEVRLADVAIRTPPS